MRHEAIQNSAAVVLVAFALGLYLAGAGHSPLHDNRKQMQARLGQEVASALDHSSLTAGEKQDFLSARDEFRRLIRAQREGKPVDPARLKQVSETVRGTLTGPMIQPQDRDRIQETLKIIDSMWREQRAKMRREALVAQLGYPMGLLADMVVSD